MLLRWLPLLLALVALQACATVVRELPSPPEGVAIGSKEFTIRSCLIAADGSRSCPAIDILVQAWYPASGPGLGPAPYLQDPDSALDVLADETGVPKFMLRRVAHIRTNAGLDAPVKAGRYPLLVFSHGFQSLRMQNTVLMERFASQGYVVLAVQHSYDAAVTALPDGRILTPAAEPPEDKSLAEEDAIRGSWTDRRVGEIRAVLDSLAQLPPDLHAVIDGERIAVLGHSMGGSTATAVCREEQRIAACVNFDGPLRGERQKAELLHPVLFLEAANPQYQTEAQERLYKKRMEAFKASAKAGLIYLRIKDTGHLSFTDFPVIARFPLSRIPRQAGTLGGRESSDVIFALSRDFIERCFRGEPILLSASDLRAYSGEVELIDQRAAWAP